MDEREQKLLDQAALTMAARRGLLGALPGEADGGPEANAVAQQPVEKEPEVQAEDTAQKEPLPVDGKGMVDSATMAGISSEGKKYADAKAQQIINQQIAAATQAGLLGSIQQPMNGMQRRIAQQRMQLSNAYNMADEAARMAMADGKEAEAKELITYRDSIAQQAQLFDQQVQMANISMPSVYGANTPLAVQQQAYAADTMAGLDRLLNKDVSSDEYYDQQYRKYRNAGYSDRRATKMAAEAAQNYYYDRIRKLNDGFNMYGLNNGAMTPDGVNLLQRLAQEDSGQANVLNNMYMNPKAAQEQAVKTALEQAKQQWEKEKFAANLQAQNARHADSMNARYASMQNSSNNIMLAHALKQQEAADKAKMVYDMIYAQTGDENLANTEAMKYYLYNGRGSGNGNANDGNWLSGMSQSNQNKFNESFANVQKAFEEHDMEAAGDAINDFKDTLNKMRPYLNQNEDEEHSYSYYLSQVYAWLAQREMASPKGSREKAKEYLSYIPEQWRDQLGIANLYGKGGK